MRQKNSAARCVRGIAILVVLAHNLHGFSSPPLSLVSNYGWMGVDLFFVLSVFLITGILLDLKSSKNYFRNFYVRRSLRIWPLYYSMLILMFVILPLVRAARCTRSFFNDQRPGGRIRSFCRIFWCSTGIGCRATRSVMVACGRRAFLSGVAVRCQVCIKGEPAVDCLGSATGLANASTAVYSPEWIIYSNPFCRLDGMMAGALLAILVRKSGFVPGRLLKVARVLFLIAVPLAITTAAYGVMWLAFR